MFCSGLKKCIPDTPPFPPTRALLGDFPSNQLTIPEASLAASSSRQSATRSRLHSGGGGGGGTTTSERSSTGEEEDGDMALAKGNAVRRCGKKESSVDNSEDSLGRKYPRVVRDVVEPKASAEVDSVSPSPCVE